MSNQPIQTLLQCPPQRENSIEFNNLAQTWKTLKLCFSVNWAPSLPEAPFFTRSELRLLPKPCCSLVRIFLPSYGILWRFGLKTPRRCHMSFLSKRFCWWFGAVRSRHQTSWMLALLILLYRPQMGRAPHSQELDQTHAHFLAELLRYSFYVMKDGQGLHEKVKTATAEFKPDENRGHPILSLQPACSFVWCWILDVVPICFESLACQLADSCFVG